MLEDKKDETNERKPSSYSYVVKSFINEPKEQGKDGNKTIHSNPLVGEFPLVYRSTEVRMRGRGAKGVKDNPPCVTS